MKRFIFLSLLSSCLTITSFAQDDLYIIPSEEHTVTEEVISKSNNSHNYYGGINKTDSEYNRRRFGTKYEILGKDSLGNQIVKFYSPEYSTDETERIYSYRDFDDFYDDFYYSRRMSRFDGYWGYYSLWNRYSPYYYSWHMWDPWYSDFYYPWGYGYHRPYGWYSSWGYRPYGFGWSYYGYWGYGYPRYGYYSSHTGTRNHAGGARATFSGSRSSNYQHTYDQNKSFGSMRPRANTSYSDTRDRSTNSNYSNFGGTRTNRNQNYTPSYNNTPRYSGGGGSFGGARGGSFGGSRGGGSFGGRR